MSKYDPLWEFVRQSGADTLKLTFGEIEQAAGIPIDHSFLNHKKKLNAYGYEVRKISLKERTVLFQKVKGAENECAREFSERC